MHNKRKMAISFDLKNFEKDKNKYANEFNNFLKLAKNKAMKFNYYKDKTNKAYRRLKIYKDSSIFYKKSKWLINNNMREFYSFKTNNKTIREFKNMKVMPYN